MTKSPEKCFLDGALDKDLSRIALHGATAPSYQWPKLDVWQVLRRLMLRDFEPCSR